MNITDRELRDQIVEAGRLLFERKVFDISGGNLSARHEGIYLMSPRYAGSRFHWKLRPEQILVVDTEGNVLDGEGEISRESRAHIRLLNEFPDGNAVVHAHSQNVLVFCALREPMSPVLEFTLKFGTIPVVEYAPGGAFSDRLAENICNGMRGRETLIRAQAAVVLAPWHGQFVLGKSLSAAIEAAECIDWNARTLLLARLFAGCRQRQEAEQQALERLASACE